MVASPTIRDSRTEDEIWLLLLVCGCISILLAFAVLA
jgi:hypothetical protein